MLPASTVASRRLAASARRPGNPQQKAGSAEAGLRESERYLLGCGVWQEILGLTPT